MTKISAMMRKRTFVGRVPAGVAASIEPDKSISPSPHIRRTGLRLFPCLQTYARGVHSIHAAVQLDRCALCIVAVASSLRA
ncbi:hypothetical protein ACFSLT_08170 [Novosphingobium resinovorum]